MQTKELNEMTNEELDEECLVKARSIYNCSVCGKICNIIDICSEAPFCSRKCLNKFYDGMGR